MQWQSTRQMYCCVFKVGDILDNTTILIMETTVTLQGKPPLLSLMISQTWGGLHWNQYGNTNCSLFIQFQLSRRHVLTVFVYVQYLLRAFLGEVLHTFLLSIVEEFLRLLSGGKQLGLLSSSFRNSVAKGGVADRFGSMDCKQREHVRKKWKGYGTCITFKKYSEKSNENPCFASLWRGKSEKRSLSWEGYKKRGRPTSLRERWKEWGGEGREKVRNNGIPLLFPFPPPFSTPDVTRPCWILKKSRFVLPPSAKLLFLQFQSSRQPFCYCPQSSMTTTALRTNINKQLSPAQKIRLCYIPKHDAR